MFTVVGQCFTYISGLPSPWNQIIMLLAILALIALASVQTIRIVPQDKIGMRLRFGKVVYKDGKPRYLRSGRVHFMIPFFYNMERISILDKVFTLKRTEVSLGAYLTWYVNASVIFAVDEPFRVRYRAEEFDRGVAAFCGRILRDCVRKVGGLDTDEKAEAVVVAFTEMVEGSAREYGLKLKSLEITSAAADSQMAIAHAIASASQPNHSWQVWPVR